MEEEAIIGQEYRVDVTLWVDLMPSATTDDLSKTVDYVDVHRIVKREMGVEASSSSRCVSALWLGCVKSFRWRGGGGESHQISTPIGGDCDHIAVVMQG